MIKLDFTNATVKDCGYGLVVNGKSLEDIISTALGTKVGGEFGIGSGLPDFSSTCCDVTVIINPKPVTTLIEKDDTVYLTVKDLEEVAEREYEQAKKKNTKTAPEI